MPSGDPVLNRVNLNSSSESPEKAQENAEKKTESGKKEKKTQPEKKARPDKTKKDDDKKKKKQKEDDSADEMFGFDPFRKDEDEDDDEPDGECEDEGDQPKKTRGRGNAGASKRPAAKESKEKTKKKKTDKTDKKKGKQADNIEAWMLQHMPSNHIDPCATIFDNVATKEVDSSSDELAGISLKDLGKVLDDTAEKHARQDIMYLASHCPMKSRHDGNLSLANMGHVSLVPVRNLTGWRT